VHEDFRSFERSCISSQIHPPSCACRPIEKFLHGFQAQRRQLELGCELAVNEAEEIDGKCSDEILPELIMTARHPGVSFRASER